MNLDTNDWTSGILHCGLSESRRTGVKMNVGSVFDLSMRYSRQTRERMRLSFGTIMPPNARANRKNDGNSQYSYDMSVHASRSTRRCAKLTDGLYHQVNPSKSAKPSH